MTSINLAARDWKHKRRTLLLFWTAVAIITAFAAFVLPFFFPHDLPVLSASYTAGDNNRVAAIAVAAVMVVVLFACWRWRLGWEPETFAIEQQQIPASWLGVAAAAMLVFTGTLGALVVRAHIFWGDEGYFLNRLRTGLILHQPLYTGFEFSYGWLLYYWPAAFLKALAPLGLSSASAYLVSLAALQIVGLGLLFYVVQALPMRRELKAVIFALLTFSFLTPLLGINYSVFRFIVPFAGIVWVTRQRSVPAASLLAVFAGFFEMACSPEMGMAFGAAVAIYGLYRALETGKQWLWVSAAAIVITLVERGSLITMARFARGEFNLIVEPLPHLLVFLIAATALAPLAVAAALRRSDKNAGMLLGIFVASLGLLPVALGRCDPIHVLFNSLGLYLLSFVAISSASQRWRRVWVIAVTVIVLLTQAVNFGTYRVPFAAILRKVPERGDAGIDVAQLEATIGSGGVAVPIFAPQTIVDDLTASGQLRPGYFSGLGWDAPAEDRTIADMRQAAFALVPTQTILFSEDMDNTRIKRVLRLGYVYKQRREPFVVGLRIARELQQHWAPVGQFGIYTLYRQVS